jgi:hypothetical protein
MHLYRDDDGAYSMSFAVNLALIAGILMVRMTVLLPPAVPGSPGLEYGAKLAPSLAST